MKLVLIATLAALALAACGGDRERTFDYGDEGVKTEAEVRAGIREDLQEPGARMSCTLILGLSWNEARAMSTDPNTTARLSEDDRKFVWGIVREECARVLVQK